MFLIQCQPNPPTLHDHLQTTHRYGTKPPPPNPFQLINSLAGQFYTNPDTNIKQFYIGIITAYSQPDPDDDPSEQYPWWTVHYSDEPNDYSWDQLQNLLITENNPPPVPLHTTNMHPAITWTNIREPYTINTEVPVPFCQPPLPTLPPIPPRMISPTTSPPKRTRPPDLTTTTHPKKQRLLTEFFSFQPPIRKRARVTDDEEVEDRPPNRPRRHDPD